MNKIGFAFSWIIVITGVITLLKTRIINLVMPKIGLTAFQVSMTGSYIINDYHIDFLGINIAAVCLIIIGVILGYIFYKKENIK